MNEYVGMPPLESPPAGMAIYLGSLGRYPTKTCIVYCGVSHVITCETTRQFEDYTSHMMSVKNEIDVLNSNVESGTMSRELYIEMVKSYWLQGIVHRFIERYGLELVPVDIRRAVTNVQHNVGVVVVNEWPSLTYVQVRGGCDVNPQST